MEEHHHHNQEVVGGVKREDGPVDYFPGCHGLLGGEATTTTLVQSKSQSITQVIPQEDHHFTYSSQSTAAPNIEEHQTASSSSSSHHHHQPPTQTNHRSLKPKNRSLKRQNEARFAFMTKSEVDHLEDGYKWRKYGQKAVKNSPFPRSYYRCTTASCNVKKRVERSFNDPTIVVTTYQGQHFHPTPLLMHPPPPAPLPPTPISQTLHFTNNLTLLPLDCGFTNTSSNSNSIPPPPPPTSTCALFREDAGLLQDIVAHHNHSLWKYY